MSEEQQQLIETQGPVVRSRTRSPNYPSMPVQDALAAVEKIWTAQHKHAAHIDALIRTLGFNKLTGPAGRAVATLAQYGLTKETGSGDNRMIALSDLALDYVLATEDQRKKDVIRTAAFKPPIFAHLLEKFGQYLPNDDTLQKHLVREKNFNPAMVAGAVADYRATFDFVNGAGIVHNEIKHIADEQPARTIHVPTSIPSALPASFRPGAAEPPKAGPTMTSGIRYLPIPLDIGDAPIPVGMSEGDFDLLLETLQLWKKKIVSSEKRGVFHGPDGDEPVIIVGSAGVRDGEEYLRLKDGREVLRVELSF